MASLYKTTLFRIRFKSFLLSKRIQAISNFRQQSYGCNRNDSRKYLLENGTSSLGKRLPLMTLQLNSSHIFRHQFLTSRSFSSNSSNSQSFKYSVDDPKKKFPTLDPLPLSSSNSSNQFSSSEINESFSESASSSSSSFSSAKSSSTLTVRKSLSERGVECLPKELQPYAILMRLNNLTGTKFLFWPCWWSIALSTSAGSLPNIQMLSLFAVGSVLLRSSGCIINDIWDRNYDKDVTRTKNRPIASKQISVPDALILFHGLNALGLLIILQFHLNSIILALCSMIPVSTYPLFKRFTHWPQLVLGMAFNWGALLGWSAACNGQLDLAAVLPLYVGGICWTLIYDTIYAHQDRKDDQKLGLKSTAIMFGDKTHQYLHSFNVTMGLSLALAGINTEQCLPYYLSLLICNGLLGSIIHKVDISDPAKCAQGFRQASHVGWILFLGIVGSTLLKKKDDEKKKNFDSGAD